MDFPIYLAMTAAEVKNCSNLPPKIAWMACHFSPYGTGLSNFPDHLPEGSLLILNDRIPISGHDPKRVASQLVHAATQWKVSGILIDFQRPVTDESLELVEQLRELPCPTAITEAYLPGTPFAIFLNAPPPHIPLEKHLQPWKARPIWLELSLETEMIRLTQKAAIKMPGKNKYDDNTVLQDNDLCCHYRISISEEQADFFIFRTDEDLKKLTDKAANLEIQMGIGLYQELKAVPF